MKSDNSKNIKDINSEITDELIRNMEQDFCSMPSCAERSITALLYYLTLKLLDASQRLDNSIRIPDDIDTEIQTELDNLKERLKIEEINSQKNDDRVTSVSINIKNKNWKRAEKELTSLLKLIRPLDMHELLRLVEKVNDAADLVRGKKIILFLGRTGTGKSTTIHFLAGSKMIQKLEDDRTIIVPAEIKNPDLEKVVCSTKASSSETRYIRPVTVNYKDVGAFSRGSIILCDSPGFGDSNGPEVDIANGIGIIRAIKGCKSVTPVVLFSYKGIGDKCEGVKELGHLLSGLVSNVQDHIGTFTYIFTKYPDSEKKEIHATLSAVNDELGETENSDVGFTDVLQDMLWKTQDGAQTLNPLTDKPGKILDLLARLTSIERPDEVFKLSLTAKTKDAVKEQLRQCRSSIASAIQRSDYSLIKYKLDQLKSLNDLLHEDHIEQAYNECIRQITRHLSNEYQNTVAMFDRCLINQTILNVEDIQQYQTCIAHFQLVEALRDSHLGKEVVHSSALISHLKQQIEVLSTDLETKDVDDLAIKVGLDKLQLLSKYFPELESTYRNICQVLVEKIDSIVDSFKKFVSSNNFKESANYLNKLNDACTNLSEHLIDGNMLGKYMELQRYLPNYLNETVGKLNTIVTKTKLEQADIDRLNNCLCMLESAKNTLAFEPHISMSEIDYIYEDFLSRVLTYVDRIIEQIDRQLNNENSFHILEQHMQQFDLIRTISIIRDQTSERYYNTLEKLIGYIREFRRIVDEQLERLFRGETNINYDKLIKCLASLKGAPWIDKYRKGIYSDTINDVEQQLMQHLKRLQESLAEITLDLDNFDQIKQAYQLVSEVNQMKRIEHIVGDISESIKEVNSWFERAINEVFVAIKSTFNVEQWREQGHPTLDLNKAEKALSYLQNCKNIRNFIQNDCASVSTHLEGFIRYYTDSIQKEMTTCFECIRQFHGENRETIFEQARLFVKDLHEISEIQANYPQIFSHFSNKKIVERWKQQLADNLIELSEEMEDLTYTSRIEELNNKLLIAKAFSRMDYFLEGAGYLNLYYKHQKIMHSQTDNIRKEVFDAIARNEYERVASEMAVLQSSNDIGGHFYKQAKGALTIGLDKLMEETKNQAIMLSYRIETEQIRSIVKNLKRLERANQFVSQHIDNAKEIDKCINDVKQLVEEQIKCFIKGVKALLTINNFSEADKKIDSISLIAKILDNYCTTDIAKQISDLREQQRKVVVEEVVNKYSQMDFSGYTLNPPSDIFAKFAEVNDSNEIYYEASSKIKQHILNKFRNELELAKKQMPPSLDSPHIRRFESNIKHLPEAMRSALEIDLQHCKDDITSNIRDHDMRLESTLKTNDLNNIEAVLKEYQSSTGMKSYENQVQNSVRQHMRELACTIVRNFDEYETIEALNNVKKLYSYKTKLGTLVDGIDGPYSTVRSRVRKAFQEAYLTFTNRFLNSRSTEISIDAIESVERSFVCLVEFMRFDSEDQEQTILDDVLPADFKETLAKFKETLLHYLTELQKKNDDLLQRLDIMSMKTSLDLLNQWNSVILKMKSYDSIYNINNTSVIRLANVIKDLRSHSQLLKLISERIENLRYELIGQDLINKETTEYEKQRNEFYRKLNEKYSFLQKAHLIFDASNQTTIDVHEIEKECIESLKQKILDIFTSTKPLIENILSNSMSTDQQTKKVNLYYYNLLSFQQEMQVKSIDINEKITSIQNMVELRIQTWVESASNETNIGNIAKCLMSMQRLADQLPAFAIRITEQIDTTLQHCKSRIATPVSLGKLGVILQQDETGVGSRIVREHKAFETFNISLFNEKTKRHGIDYVLANSTGDLIDTNLLKKRYDEFEKLYQALIHQYLKSDVKLDTLISDTLLLSGNVKLHSNALAWNSTVRAKIPTIAAHVFALWTLQKASNYFEAADTDNQDGYLIQPHAAQVVSIFRMLGIGDKNEQLVNNLVQIGTGEGKSITLGATATILALLGFEVRCACYSEYLSQRDYSAFLPLFDSLGLLEYIHYGTFNKLCEAIINENGNIRQRVEEFIVNDSNHTAQAAQQKKRPKILLIDEVDVFFSRDFYGNVYTPSASLRDPTITALINLIWKERNSKLNLNKLELMNEYRACCQRFPNWKLLIDQAIKDLLFDVSNFQSHDYVVKQDKIGYIEQDNIVYNVMYGYKTLFAYYYEHEKGNISQKSLEENIAISLKCGNFSYAEVPLKFAYIMGVTGTLNTLSEPEKRVIQEDYKIRRSTYTPSVFGPNNLRFIPKDDIKLEDESDYFNTIKREIDDRLIGRSTEKRAVLVVFESIQKLKEFYESKALESIKPYVSYLTEEASAEEKNHLVNRATTSGQITLITRTFGRGTDFVCHDQRVGASGGVHVIQTFLSEEVSEEVQIKGRTARQGDHGSYSLILNYRDLERFHIKKENIDDIKKGKGILVRLAGVFSRGKTYDTIYDFLHDRRVDLFKTQYEDNMKYVVQARKRHIITQEFLANLNAGKIDAVRAFLADENKGAEDHVDSRTICLMDATGSMTHLLHKCKTTVDIMVHRASEILKEYGIGTNSFQIQFVVYRNYNSKEEKILQSSAWETRPDNLRAFMNTIEVEGGWSNEAIEVGLWHANKENEREPITQVILIGDAPPNSQSEVKKKRENFGEAYWKGTKFAQATYYEDEVAQLRANRIPIHAFYVEKKAESVFRSIAQQTNGRCEMLDINSSTGSDMLTDFVTEEILRGTVGHSKGNEIVQAYQKRYGKSYT